MSMIRRVASAGVLAVTATGAVLSLTGAARVETGWPSSLPAGASSAPPGITCCAIGHPSVASLDTDYPASENLNLDTLSHGAENM